jgi:hypothetical protein
MIAIAPRIGRRYTVFGNVGIGISRYNIDLFFFFWQYWGLNSGFHTGKGDALPFEPNLQCIVILIILEIGVS